MGMLILTVAIRHEQDVVLARKRARQIAGMLGFDRQEEVRIATAVSEIARNAYQYAKRGKAEYWYVAEEFPVFRIRIVDEGAGIERLEDILEGRYKSRTGMGLGIVGARRLMDGFRISSTPGEGTDVELEKKLPRGAPLFSPRDVSTLAEKLTREVSYDPFSELQRQNQELLTALDQLEMRQKQLAMVNKELEDTNRGVVALYAELDERAEALRRTADLKTQFLSNMSHEFRTPLNSILSLSHILLEQTDGVLTEEQIKQVRFIEKAAAGLSELVNDMLDLARAEAGKVQIHPNTFTVDSLFGALRGMLRPLLANNSVQLVFEESENIPPLHTDESKVSQVLRNFISNALKFTEQGEVRVSARLGPEEHVIFSVADTGIGIDPTDQTRIFEEYVQVEGPHQRGKRGTGLGLPLSKQLTHLLGGHLTLRSAPGLGSTFSVTIPIRFGGPSEVTYGPDIIRDVDRTRLPVLIVEDNLETQFIYEKLLRGTGFQPIPVRTLNEARQAMLEVRPVAVLLDILLNNENAWGFLSELKSNPETKAIPVYVVTMVDNQQKALSLGADDFFAKPLDHTWLLNKLRQLETTRKRPDLLVIDDDEVSRYLLKGHLSDTFSHVLEASSGQEGIRIAKERHPAAIFLDLMMPDLDGFAVLEKLKSDPSTRDIPVIVHSARTLSDQDKARLTRDAAAIVPKNPAEREATLLLIRKALHSAAVLLNRGEGVRNVD